MSKKLYVFISIVLLLTGCRVEEETSTFWDSILVDSEYRPFIFVFSNTNFPICANHAQPKLEAILNNEVDSIDGDFINGLMMYPTLTDNYYSNIAEEIKFLYDNNGDKTLKTTPAFFSNMKCHNIDSIELIESIFSQRRLNPQINLGIKSTVSGKNLKVYVRGIYKSSFTASNHSLAVYSYRKSELGNHAIENGTEIFTMKNNVFSSLTPSMGKSLTAASSGTELRELLTLDVSNEYLFNIGIVAVLYELENGKPISVVNSIKLENN
jgi:hypothetical protein